MSIGCYMDVHVPRATTDHLRRAGVDVLTAQEDGTAELSDSELLDRASELGRILFTQDTDLLAEASSRQRTGVHFVGVIYASQTRTTISQCVADLELIAKANELAKWINRVEYIPLK